MIADDHDLKVTFERIARFQAQAVHLRNTESSAVNYHAAVAGFLAEIDRMQLEVRDYLSIRPRDSSGIAGRGADGGTA